MYNLFEGAYIIGQVHNIHIHKTALYHDPLYLQGFYAVFMNITATFFMQKYSQETAV